MGDEHKVKFNFENCSVTDLQDIDIMTKHKIVKTGTVHGYAVWFTALFNGSD